MRYVRGLVYFWLIVSTPLLGMTGFAQGAFLCWGSDGHVGIEIESCDPHRESASVSADHSGLSDHFGCQDDDSCGTCIDIPLPLGGATTRVVRPERAGASRGLALVTQAAESHDSVTAGGGYCRRGRPARADESIASLRTIVLLI